MTLNEFIENLKKDYNLKKDVSEIRAIIVKKAHAEAKNGCAVIDDDTVKDWIINSDAEKLVEPTPKAEVRTSNVAQKLYDKYVKEEKPKKEEKKDDYQQITLFDL